MIEGSIASYFVLLAEAVGGAMDGVRALAILEIFMYELIYF